METTVVSTNFSLATRNLVSLGRKVPVPRCLFVQTKLDKRTSTSDIVNMAEGKFLQHKKFLYIITFPSFIKKEECYLVAHYSKTGQRCLSYIVFDDEKKNFYVHTEKNPKGDFLWNYGIILITY